jgi:hypothetical protein
MTDSVRKQIVDLAIAKINTSAPAGIPIADDTRLPSYTPDELPAITVFEIREDGQVEKEGRWSYFVKRAFTLRVETRIAETLATKCRQAMDPLYVWVGQSLGAFQFGGLAEDCYETLLEWQYADADQAYTLLQTDFRVEYSTLKNDPSKTH